MLQCWFYAYCPQSLFEVSDEDAAEFLQSQFSNELRPFESGMATYGLWLNLKGKVLGDGVVLCRDACHFQIFSEGSDGATIRAHLEHHIIADDVEIKPSDGALAFELSADACSKLEIAPPEPGRFTETDYGCLWNVVESCYTLLVESDVTAGFLRKRLAEIGCSELSPTERGLQRIDEKRPLVPDEIGPGDLPGEGELERTAISLKKGCFLGQEVVARMHNLGQAQRRLFVVEGRGAPPALPVSVFKGDSKQVGEVRSAYEGEGSWRGIALLKRRFVSAGETLCSGESSITVLHALSERELK
jgi:folate-binding protein YgfZ